MFWYLGLNSKERLLLNGLWLEGSPFDLWTFASLLSSLTFAGRTGTTTIRHSPLFNILLCLIDRWSHRLQINYKFRSGMMYNIKDS